MKEITEQQARQMVNAGLTTENYRIVKRSLEDRLVDALLLHSTFCTHAGFAININMTSEKSATVFSSKDRNEYRVDFELDAFDEPRVTNITPIRRLEPNQEVIREQLNQQWRAGIPIDEKDLTQLRALNEQQEKASAQKLQLVQLSQQRIAGVISHDEYFEQRDQLLIDQHKDRTAGKKLLFEDGEDNATKRAKLWEAQRAGKISLDECLERTAKIRLAEERALKPRWLTERQCEDACECASCDLSACREQLDDAVRRGLLNETESAAVWKSRLEMD